MLGSDIYGRDAFLESLGYVQVGESGPSRVRRTVKDEITIGFESTIAQVIETSHTGPNAVQSCLCLYIRLEQYVLLDHLALKASQVALPLSEVFLLFPEFPLDLP